MKKLLVLASLLTIAACTKLGTYQGGTVYFPEGGSALDAKQLAVVKQQARLLNTQYKNVMVEVDAGYSITGVDKNCELNLNLAQKRARSLRAALIADGVSADRIVVAKKDPNCLILNDQKSDMDKAKARSGIIRPLAVSVF